MPERILRQRFNHAVQAEPDIDNNALEIEKREKQVAFEKKQWMSKVARNLVAPTILFALALFTRLYKIGLSNVVVWDEAHFGKFASFYLKREFYFDVHPPLGKMLNALAGWVAGYDGQFSFESGSKYPDGMKYQVMRGFNALWGSLTVPIAYLTALRMGLSFLSALLIANLVLFDNFMAVLSRFILLDSALLFFTTTTFFCLVQFHSYRGQPFTAKWFVWLYLLGVSLGCVCSIKWVGLLVTGLVGLYTIEDLWNKFADYEMPKVDYLKHWIYRTFFLIIVPAMVYVFTFYIHFKILVNSGTGDAQMSSLFQANLNGSDLREAPIDVYFGSKVTIKSMSYGGGLLHSHVQTYPGGSSQQQITCYHHRDGNNDWMIRLPHGAGNDTESKASSPLFDQTIVRLIHSSTGRNLHTHEIAAHITKEDREVSCYGNGTVGDDKDHWVIEIVKERGQFQDKKIHPLTTAFRLKNTVLGCYLRATKKHYPEWGFRQIEVTCTRNCSPRDRSTHWNVENHWNENLPKGSPEAYRPKFLNDVIDLNVAMANSNNALTADPDKFDALTSNPWQWPLGFVSLRMCSWNDDSIKFLMVSNPLVSWISFAGVAILSNYLLLMLLRWRRGYRDLSEAQYGVFQIAGIYALLGWVLHYVPFYIMGRVLYMHHYEPAMYFAIFSAGYIFEIATKQLPRRLRIFIYLSTVAAVMAIFINLSPFTFGMVGPNSKYSGLEWFKSWKVSKNYEG